MHILLYRTVQFNTTRPTPLTKEYQPRLIRSPTNHDIRSQENSERNETQQGPGIDYLASDVILGGEDKTQ